VDLRKNLRFHVHFRSSFSSVGMVGGEGDIVDLSISGCRIESVTDVQPGASLEVRIVTKAQEPPLQIQQAIVRRTAIRPGVRDDGYGRVGSSAAHRGAD
jgi:PilZ domain